MAKPIAVEKCVASRQWADNCLLQVDAWVQAGAVYGLLVVYGSKCWWQVMLSSELAWVMQKGYSACRQRLFALGVDETTRFRDESCRIRVHQPPTFTAAHALTYQISSSVYLAFTAYWNGYALVLICIHI